MPLASFKQRAIAFAIDLVLALIVLMIGIGITAFCYWMYKTGGKGGTFVLHFDEKSWYGQLILDILLPILYFGLSTYFWNGKTPGKRIMKIRTVSLIHKKITLWHSIERALGYIAASLEFGFGFFQYFIHPNHQTVQDRIAETIVISEPKPANARKKKK